MQAVFFLYVKNQESDVKRILNLGLSILLVLSHAGVTHAGTWKKVGNPAVETENAACSTVGAIGSDATGKILSCQGGLWKSSGGKSVNYLAAVSVSYNSYYQAPSDGWLNVNAEGSYFNGLEVLAGASYPPSLRVALMGDDINNNTKASSAMIPLRAGDWILVRTAIVGSSDGVLMGGSSYLAGGYPYELISIKFIPSN